MKKSLKLLPFAVLVPVILAISTHKAVEGAFAAGLYEKGKLPTTIELYDCTADDIRK